MKLIACPILLIPVPTQPSAPVPVAFERVDIELGSRPYNLEVADYDRDGDPDLAVVSQVDGTVTVAWNQGGGVFQTSEVAGNLTRPEALAAGDYDGDGDLDLAVAEYSGHRVALLENEGSGELSVGDVFQVGQQPHQVVSADFNGDGRLDLATANDAETFVTVLLNRPTR